MSWISMDEQKSAMLQKQQMEKQLFFWDREPMRFSDGIYKSERASDPYQDDHTASACNGVSSMCRWTGKHYNSKYCIDR